MIGDCGIWGLRGCGIAGRPTFTRHPFVACRSFAHRKFPLSLWERGRGEGQVPALIVRIVDSCTTVAWPVIWEVRRA